MFDFTPPPALVEMGLAVAPGYAGIRDAVTVLTLRGVGHSRGGSALSHGEAQGPQGRRDFVGARVDAAEAVADALRGVDVFNLETGAIRGPFAGLEVNRHDGRAAIHHGAIGRSAFSLGDEPLVVRRPDGELPEVFPQLRPRMGPRVAAAAIQAVADRLGVTAQAAAIALCDAAVRGATSKGLVEGYSVDGHRLSISHRGQLSPMVLDLSTLRDGGRRGRRVLSSR